MARGKADYQAPGTYNAICFFCGRKNKAGDLIRYWQGFYVCPTCWEPRHPQDFVRGVPDEQAPPWTQPPADRFTQFCTANGSSAVPGFAIPGCAVPGFLSPAFNPEGDPFDA